MKWMLALISIVGLCLIFVFCPISNGSEVEYLRIHIRANSNSQEDQAIKYLVKDAVVEALIPLLSEVDSFEKAKQCIADNFDLIESVADEVLSQGGFSYCSNACIQKENFPTREYDGLVLEEGEYEALILNLGSGEGNNWWCLVYPAFCFTSSTNSDNVVYISKILQIIKEITKGD